MDLYRSLQNPIIYQTDQGSWTVYTLVLDRASTIIQSVVVDTLSEHINGIRVQYMGGYTAPAPIQDMSS